jgi:hypothetical protein
MAAFHDSVAGVERVNSVLAKRSRVGNASHRITHKSPELHAREDCKRSTMLLQHLAWLVAYATALPTNYRGGDHDTKRFVIDTDIIDFLSIFINLKLTGKANLDGSDSQVDDRLAIRLANVFQSRRKAKTLDVVSSISALSPVLWSIDVFQ